MKCFYLCRVSIRYIMLHVEPWAFQRNNFFFSFDMHKIHNKTVNNYWYDTRLYFRLNRGNVILQSKLKYYSRKKNKKKKPCTQHNADKRKISGKNRNMYRRYLYNKAIRLWLLMVVVVVVTLSDYIVCLIQLNPTNVMQTIRFVTHTKNLPDFWIELWQCQKNR